MDRNEAKEVGFRKFCKLHEDQNIRCFRVARNPHEPAKISGPFEDGLELDAILEPTSNGFLYKLAHTHAPSFFEEHMFTCNPTNSTDEGTCI